MKTAEKLQRSYEKQRLMHEEARQQRISNRQKMIKNIDDKIAQLTHRREEIQKQILNDTEFESFESFRQKSEQQSSQQKRG